MRPRTPFADGDGNRRAGVLDFVAALQAFRERHTDRAHPAFAEVLLHFHGELGGLAVDRVIDGEGVEQFGQMSVGEFDIDDGPDDLNDFTDAGSGGSSGNHRIINVG